jgi:hypothetical protein
MTLSRRISIFTLTLVFGLSATASAQLGSGLRKGGQPAQPAPIDDPAGWGTSSPSTVTFAAFEFVEFFTTGAFGAIDQNNGMASCASGFCIWLAALRIPTGASIRAMEVSACDGDGAGQVAANVAAGPKVPGADPTDIISPVETGVAATPGCNNFQLFFANPPFVTVDNGNNFYIVQVGADAGTNLKWNQARVRYRLQVSPAPGTATFTDVPLGHPQRQFIEALVAAGITGGCGGGNYCPDTPLTRGQMAVFLAVALGLHWPF